LFAFIRQGINIRNKRLSHHKNMIHNSLKFSGSDIVQSRLGNGRWLQQRRRMTRDNKQKVNMSEQVPPMVEAVVDWSMGDRCKNTTLM
jgi:hypothetical protein